MSDHQTSNLESLVRLLIADGGMSWPSNDECTCSACRLKRKISAELDRLAVETSGEPMPCTCREGLPRCAAPVHRDSPAETEGRTYSCNFCEQMFPTSSGLDCHELTCDARRALKATEQPSAPATHPAYHEPVSPSGFPVAGADLPDRIAKEPQ